MGQLMGPKGDTIIFRQNVVLYMIVRSHDCGGLHIVQKHGWMDICAKRACMFRLREPEPSQEPWRTHSNFLASLPVPIKNTFAATLS